MMRRLSLAHWLTVLAALSTLVLALLWTRSVQDLTPVATAGEAIPAGNRIEASSVVWVDAQSDMQLDGLIIDGSVLEGEKVAARAISAGEPILVSDVRSVEDTDGLRAMSLPIPRDHAVGGDLGSGDRVDVIGVGEDGQPSVVAADVAVLATARSGGEGLAAGAWWVTVSVDAATARRLAGAMVTDEVFVVRSTGAEPIPVGETTPPPTTPPTTEGS